MSDDEVQPRTTQQTKAEPRQARFFEWDIVGPAYHGATDVVDKQIAKGLDVNMVDQSTGLSALHVAVGTNNLALTKKLVEEHGAAFFADKRGRWPSVIAIECEVSDELAVYIAEAEARFLEQESSK
ncbi:ankyrin repeat domain-containing protein [Ruegeria sp. HKCCA4812]|uniref:ankyrin repeat domain-containing protein n=1 Tax=Ruegeria sp. HKCCA4812 TaxID=2682993 RepID=UPI001C2CAD81|nr:ankyrin repeat domain-containing protein [Ruegeria sp. HKCCA4812]